MVMGKKECDCWDSGAKRGDVSTRWMSTPRDLERERREGKAHLVLYRECCRQCECIICTYIYISYIDHKLCIWRMQLTVVKLNSAYTLGTLRQACLYVVIYLGGTKPERDPCCKLEAATNGSFVWFPWWHLRCTFPGVQSLERRAGRTVQRGQRIHSAAVSLEQFEQCKQKGPWLFGTYKGLLTVYTFTFAHWL